MWTRIQHMNYRNTDIQTRVMRLLWSTLNQVQGRCVFNNHQLRSCMAGKMKEQCIRPVIYRENLCQQRQISRLTVQSDSQASSSGQTTVPSFPRLLCSSFGEADGMQVHFLILCLQQGVIQLWIKSLASNSSGGPMIAMVTFCTVTDVRIVFCSPSWP